ncbi:hypothetical protein SMD44_03999 [Streptomyces alboflavus]|uniref:Uncharacterized protein n=1 Tax=Streptomyces alboflavus TaxID=67267 RepID=A0A1Z1WDZ2_9ACTN|nr:hypothetical protein SMD44_03999 [Streptomyces alboflavus]
MSATAVSSLALGLIGARRDLARWAAVWLSSQPVVGGQWRRAGVSQRWEGS